MGEPFQINIPGLEEEAVISSPCPECQKPMVVVVLDGMDTCPHCGADILCTFTPPHGCVLQSVEITEDPVEFHRRRADECKTLEELREVYDEILGAADMFEGKMKTLRTMVRKMYVLLVQGPPSDHNGPILVRDSGRGRVH